MALVVRQGSSVIEPAWTVAEVVWTRQLIRESRWRFAGLMEHIPTLLVVHVCWLCMIVVNLVVMGGGESPPSHARGGCSDRAIHRAYLAPGLRV